MKVKDYLIEEQGFNVGQSNAITSTKGCTWCMYRRTTKETNKLCLTNDNKPQIGVFYYEVEVNGHVHTSYEVEIVQENNLSWINFSYYGLSESDMLLNFDKIEQSLIQAWEASWEITK